LEWQGEGAVCEVTSNFVDEKPANQSVNFLDVSIRIVQRNKEFGIEFKVFHKPGNSYSYLPFGSFHARHVMKGWIKAELLRLLTHSSNFEDWIEECRFFYEHLRGRGYPIRELRSAFKDVSWTDRAKFLAVKQKSDVENEQFFVTYKGCVFSTCNSPGISLFRKRINMSLQLLNESNSGIFPDTAFFSVRGAMPLG